MSRMSRMRAMALALALVLCAPLAAAATTRQVPRDAVLTDLPALYRWAAAWAERGVDDPETALRQIDQLLAQPPQGKVDLADWQRVLWRARGMVAARTGRSDAAQQAIDRLDPAARPGDPADEAAITLARADADMLRAERLEYVSDPAQAVPLGRALAAWARVCDAPSVGPRCDPWLRAYAYRWQAINQAQLDHLTDAIADNEAALALSREVGDTLGTVRALGKMAHFLHDAGEREAAWRRMDEAMQMANDSRDPAIQAWANLLLGVAHVRARDLDAGLAPLQRCIALARAQDMRALESRALTHIADLYLLRKDGPRALEAVTRNWQLLPEWADALQRHVVRVNRGLALILMGQKAAGGAEIEAVLRDMELVQSRRLQADVLAEYADALAATGDAAGALSTYHREQALRDQVAVNERRVALQAAESRFDRRVQEQALAQLERSNDLKAAQLESQTLRQWLWTALAVCGLGAAAAAVWARRRLLTLAQGLVRSRARLQAQSERDPLTGLANRRHFERRLAQAQAEAPDGGISGTLLMVDVDHFKQINDTHGHAAGDAALKAIARRLAGAVREGDAVGRWGGEEFLVHAPATGAADARETGAALAQRLAEAVAAEPLSVGRGVMLPVRVSVGWAHFPLRGQQVPLGWGAALRLVDRALYDAKAAGRNRCVGIAAADIAVPDDVAALEADWAAALASGRVQLVTSTGAPKQST